MGLEELEESEEEDVEEPLELEDESEEELPDSELLLFDSELDSLFALSFSRERLRVP